MTLRDALASVPTPNRVRFFRSQMQTTIARACGELGVKPLPSLLLRLERSGTRCVSLERRYAFGAGLDLNLLGFELDGSTLVPGVAPSLWPLRQFKMCIENW